MRHTQINNRVELNEALKTMVWEINRSLASHNPKILYMVATKWEMLLRELRSGCKVKHN